ncbi:SH3 domain-containing protein [Yoonia maritima]|uniref:SH3 domain-containing protein n=1 Tax=Yoonia maritima TaxID=1435347 RepID=A0A2T0VV93_9RHOB|nr:SH3 domain-containing protein [Yoonia maritima]PRY75491.1 SH3 domain-containing protein [Yoonia maritima]
MYRSNIPVILAFMLVASCGGSFTDRTVVKGAGPDELLKLRAGPGLGYNVILGLPDGTLLNRKNCVTEVGQLWCQVSLSNAPQVTGYVSADYLPGR